MIVSLSFFPNEIVCIMLPPPSSPMTKTASGSHFNTAIVPDGNFGTNMNMTDTKLIVNMAVRYNILFTRNLSLMMPIIGVSNINISDTNIIIVPNVFTEYPNCLVHVDINPAMGPMPTREINTI